MRIRQVALVASKLEPLVPDLCEILGIEVSINDPGIVSFGLENAVMPIGDTFLEVVAPIQENTTAGRLLERRKGDGGYMVILQTDDLERERQRMEALGVRIVWQIKHDDAESIHLHPRDVGAAIVSFDVARPPESWRWAGPEWRAKVRTEVSTKITGVEVQATDPKAMAERWAEVINRDLKEDATGEYRLDIDGDYARFVQETDGRGDGVSGIDIEVKDKARLLETARAKGYPTQDRALQIGGVTFRIL